MSPIDQDVRDVLASRAATVAPLADPMRGVERRAARFRRTRRIAVAGSVLGVVAVATVAAPALRRSPVAITPVTSASPSPSASPVAQASPFALDPGNPWPYRGDPRLAAGTGAYATAWAAKHGTTADRVTWTPLFGQAYEPSDHDEVVYVATLAGEAFYGVVVGAGAGPRFVVDVPLARETTVLLIPLAGDEVPRLLVLAAQSIGQLEYAADGRAYVPLPGHVPGYGVMPLEGDTSRDRVRVLDGDGDLDHPVFDGPAPDYASGS